MQPVAEFPAAHMLMLPCNPQVVLPEALAVLELLPEEILPPTDPEDVVKNGK